MIWSGVTSGQSPVHCQGEHPSSPRGQQEAQPWLLLLFLLFPLWMHRHIRKSPYWPLVTWNTETGVFSFCFTLPVAGLSACGSVRLGTCWTWRICPFAQTAASVGSSRQRFGLVVFSSAKSKKRADGNTEGISLDWAKKDGRAELWCWCCVPRAKRRVWQSDPPPSSCSHPFS